MQIKFNEIKVGFKKRINLYKALYTDKDTPTISKVFLWLAIGYLFMPFDLIPDFIPIIGQLDDVIIVPGLIFIALKFIPRSIYQKHFNRIFR